MDNKDLERLEKLAREAADGYVVWPNSHQIADGITQEDASALMEAMTPATVLQLISMARRATHASQQGEEDARDAARYRWLREQHGVSGDFPVDGDVWVVQMRQAPGAIPELRCAGFGAKLDAAIDAARAAHPGKEEGGK